MSNIKINIINFGVGNMPVSNTYYATVQLHKDGDYANFNIILTNTDNKWGLKYRLELPWLTGLPEIDPDIEAYIPMIKEQLIALASVIDP